MIKLRHPALFRPASRPTSPSPSPTPLTRTESNLGSEKPVRPSNKLNFNSFRKTAPSATVPAQNNVAPLVQDGSYLEMLGLKLSEGVSKVTAQPIATSASSDQLAHKRPIPSGRGRMLGDLIASELNAASNNPHLSRAILRSLHKPLSVLLTTLSAHLLPLLSSPAFSSTPTPQAPNVNATQLHALAIAVVADELLQSFDELGLGNDNDVRGDGLKVIREGLVSLVCRVVTPLVNGIKTDLMAMIDALETPSAGTVGPKGTKVTTQHPSITQLQSFVPIYARAMEKYTSTIQSQNALATFMIAVIWRSLVALSRRPHVPTSPPASPAMGSIGLRKHRGGSTPPMTPPAARFTMKLPPSRPPSPPAMQITSSPASDARTLYSLLKLFPSISTDLEATRLAHEVVDEAFRGLHALPALLEASNPPSKIGQLPEIRSAEELRELTADLPTLISLPLVLRAFGENRSVASILGISDDQYKNGCLSGFGRAESCAEMVGQKVLEVICADGNCSSMVVSWLTEEIDGAVAAY